MGAEEKKNSKFYLRKQRKNFWRRWHLSAKCAEGISGIKLGHGQRPGGQGELGIKEGAQMSLAQNLRG